MNTERVIAYRCPVCGTAIVGDLNLFVLGGQELTLSCKECGEESPSLKASLTREKKLSLAIPCLTCPSPHRFTVDTQVVFSRDLFVLQCPMTALDLCFIGDEKKVEEALEENRKQLLELTGGEWMEDDFDDFDDNEEELSEEELNELKEHPPLLDAHLMGQMLYLVRDLAEDGKIYCSCGEKHVDFHLLPDGIAFSCPKCNAARVFPAHTESDLERLSELDALVLNSEEDK
ncbi:MAG: hypothetical protein IKT43_00810 [Clostridia bacterium]|nr:hypothetical protein [Clostridia bacterium]